MSGDPEVGHLTLSNLCGECVAFDRHEIHADTDVREVLFDEFRHSLRTPRTELDLEVSRLLKAGGRQELLRLGRVVERGVQGGVVRGRGRGPRLDGDLAEALADLVHKAGAIDREEERLPDTRVLQHRVRYVASRVEEPDLRGDPRTVTILKFLSNATREFERKFHLPGFERQAQSFHVAELTHGDAVEVWPAARLGGSVP